MRGGGGLQGAGAAAMSGRAAKAAVPCQFFLTGSCRDAGDACRFSHDPAVCFPGALADEACEHFAARGFCRNGNRCLYSHDLAAREAVQAEKARRMGAKPDDANRSVPTISSYPGLGPRPAAAASQSQSQLPSQLPSPGGSGGGGASSLAELGGVKLETAEHVAHGGRTALLGGAAAPGSSAAAAAAARDEAEDDERMLSQAQFHAQLGNKDDELYFYGSLPPVDDGFRTIGGGGGSGGSSGDGGDGIRTKQHSTSAPAPAPVDWTKLVDAAASGDAAALNGGADLSAAANLVVPPPLVPDQVAVGSFGSTGPFGRGGSDFGQPFIVDPGGAGGAPPDSINPYAGMSAAPHDHQAHHEHEQSQQRQAWEAEQAAIRYEHQVLMQHQEEFDSFKRQMHRGGGGGTVIPTAAGMNAPVCKFFLQNACRMGANCRFAHRAEEFNPEAELERFERSASKDLDCGICLEIVSQQPDPRFGLLTGCDHAFCLRCIKNWRTSDMPVAAKDDGKQLVRRCPLCREPSFFVVPCDRMVRDPARKGALIDEYKHGMKSIHCMHFNRGEGVCPFGSSCFYKHVYANGEEQDPGELFRTYKGADGKTQVDKVSKLGAYFDKAFSVSSRRS